MTEASVQPEASTVSTGPSIRYIGNHVYAYNNVEAAVSDTAVLDFVTGAGYIVGTIQFNGYIQATNPATGSIGTCNVKFNGLTVINFKIETEVENNSPHSVAEDILIPPLTSVEVSLRSTQAESTQIATVGIVGRVYGAE